MIQIPWKLSVIAAELSERAYTEQTVKTDLAHCLIEKRQIDGLEYVFVIFRGTANRRDFLTDADVVMVPVDGSKGVYHRGFDLAERSVAPLLQDHFLFKKGIAPLMVIGGHSLGMGIARRFAWRVAKNRWPVRLQAVIGFGGPRGADAVFAREYSELLGDITFQWMDEEDVVPRIPHFLWKVGWPFIKDGEWGWPLVRRLFHTETRCFITSKGRLVVDPSFLRRFASDMHGYYKIWKRGGIILLAEDPLNDHHAGLYRTRVEAAWRKLH